MDEEHVSLASTVVDMIGGVLLKREMEIALRRARLDAENWCARALTA